MMQSAVAQILPRISDGAVCLLPNLSAAARLRRNLAYAAPAKKLPPILTFRQVSAAVRILPDANPDSILRAARLGAPDPADDNNTLTIFAVLRENSRRSPAADLRLAARYAQFFREMDQRGLNFPSTHQETLRQVAADYSPAVREALSAQTQELFDLWQALSADSTAAKHRRALARLADEWSRPLFVVGPETEREPLESEFCRRIQERGGECVFIAPDESPAAVFARKALSGAKLNSQSAAELRAHFSGYRQGGAASLTEAAELALGAAAEFAADGAKKIGVIVLDRVLARRMNAMALSAGKKIVDRNGWLAETLAFGAALRMLADAGADRFSSSALSELLRAPPLFAGQHQHFRREDADAEWRAILRNDWRLPTNANEIPESAPALGAAAAALDAIRGKFAGRKTAAAWLDLICAEADGGVLAKWRGEDAVADRVMTLLAKERESAQVESAALDAHEFRAWFSQLLEARVTVTEDDEGDHEGGGVLGMVFLSPVEAVMREFDALILLGGGGDYLPRRTDADPLLTERERRALGLPGREEFLRRQRERFCGWVGECGRVALVWRGAGGKDDIPPSPYWELLREGLSRAGVLGAEEDFAAAGGLSREVDAEGVFPPVPAGAVVRGLPARVSATAAERLMECPYLFFARDILGLESDEADESPSAGMLGGAAHWALARFARTRRNEVDAEKIRAHLDGVLAELESRGNRPGFVLAIRRWRERAHIFAEWESARRREGWRTVEREKMLSVRAELGDGTEVELRGRLDRVDRNGAAWAVADYKTGMIPSLRELDAGEHPQLPLYAAMLAAAEADGEKEGEERVGVGVGVPEWFLCRPFPGRGEKSAVLPKKGAGDELERGEFARLVMERFCATLREIGAGAVLPASGVPSSCARCFARGLCRREHWAQNAVELRS